jgi:uncharacterized protein YgiM (DUF1202 family)
MIRLTILLCGALFATMQIMGEDRGQMRLGLIEAEKEAALIAAKEQASVTEVASQSNLVSPAAPARSAQSTTQGAVTIAFSPSAQVVTKAKPAPKLVEATPVAAKPASQDGQVMFVSGRSVNVRGGPSTQDAVVGRLTRGEAVMVVWVEDNGWARIRVEGDGIDGYMAMDFLTDTAE